MRLTLAFTLALTVAPLAAQPVPAPTGWTATQSGSSWIYAPTNVPTGRTFTLTVEPVQTIGGESLDRWLVSHAQADASRHGTLIGGPSAPHNTNGAWITNLSYRDSQGVQWIALYTAAPRPNGGVQPTNLTTNLTTSASTDYARTAGSIVGGIPATTQSGAAPKSTAAQPSPVPVTATPSSDDRIAAILHEGRGISTVTGYQFIESVDLLLTDGWAYLGLTTPPEYLDVEASKQREPTKWHHWKSSGSDFLVETNGQWTKLIAERVRPLPAGTAMSISLTHRNSTSFGLAGSYNSSQTITLDPGGRYQRSSGVIAGSGSMQAAQGFSAGAGSYQNQNQRSSAAGGGNGSVTATSRSSGPGDPNLGGRYKVSGYTLELDGAGGSVSRVLAFYPFANTNESVYIGGATYSTDKH